MSDHEESVHDAGFGTPMLELDDHRRFSPPGPKSERSRRGTFDTLYGARVLEQGSAIADPGFPITRVRDFEEAVVDDDAVDTSPTARRGRRPTVETVADRTESPPNSVKAFAEARRRERDWSFSEPKGDRRGEDDELHRAQSVASRRSHRSKPYTVDNDAASIATNKTAEDDVCFPLQEDHHHRKDELYIDFDYLENFIQSENAARAMLQADAEARVFSDLRPQSSDETEGRLQLSTVDGDILDMPSDASVQEKETKLRAADAEESQPQPVPLDPNRFSFFSSAWESTIHAAEFGDLVLPGEDIRGLFTLPRDESDGVWWLNVNHPTKEEVQSICKAFGIHPLTIEDITTQEAREKIELFPSYYFACFRSFKTVEESDGHEYEPFNIYVVVFREGTLSFSFSPNAHASHVRKRIALLKDYVALSSDWICYALIDDIVDSFAPVIRQIELEADAIEDAVFVARQDDANSFLRSIGRVRKNTMALMRLLGGKADVLRGFTKRCNENYKVTPRMDIGLYLGDIQDHVVTMVTNLGHFEKMLSRAHSNYLAQLSISSISQGTDTNRVLSKITFLASILVPLNLVCGLFGMNVPVPFRDSESIVPFFVILGSLILFCIVCLAWARKYHYI